MDQSQNPSPLHGIEQVVTPRAPAVPPGAILPQSDPINILVYRAEVVAEKLRKREADQRQALGAEE